MVRVFKKNSKAGRAMIEKKGRPVSGNRHADPKSSRDVADTRRVFRQGEDVKIKNGKLAGRCGPIAWIGASKWGGVRVGVKIDDGVVFVSQDDLDPAWKPPR